MQKCEYITVLRPRVLHRAAPGRARAGRTASCGTPMQHGGPGPPRERVRPARHAGSNDGARSMPEVAALLLLLLLACTVWLPAGVALLAEQWFEKPARPATFAAPGGSWYLSSGATLKINTTMYMHSFTLVQQVRVKNDDSFGSGEQQGLWLRHPVGAAGHRKRAITFYGALQSPREHPLAGRRAVSPPEYSAFGPSGIGWMALRGFGTNASGALQDVDELLDQYTTGRDAVSSVLWPNVATAAASNFVDLIGKLNQRNLSLMMGGFVPGGRNQFDTSRLRNFGAVQSLGVRYLGFGQSEQDGRYLAYLEEGKYDVSGTTTGDTTGRFPAYTAFRHYSSTIERLAGEKLYALDRGVFVHYYLQTGLYTLAGAELSGGLNAQLTYAFVRGAAKQYGTLLLSNVCSFTRWGHKIPADPSPTPSCERGSDHGDTCGTSYSAMKRMLYTLMMYLLHTINTAKYQLHVRLVSLLDYDTSRYLCTEQVRHCHSGV